MGKINMKNKTILGILALSSLSSLSTTFYVKNDAESKLKDNHNTTLGYSISNDLNIGALLGKNKEVFVYLGGKIEKNEKTKDGKVNIGFGFKKNINEHIELTLNGGFQYKDGMEDSIKEGLKLRGLWDKKYEDDEKARRELYHSQGLRLKGNQILASGVLDLDYDTTKSKIGIIYTTDSFNSGMGRLESFVNLKQKFGRHELEVNLNHKAKNTILDKLGRLKGDVKLSSKYGNLEIIGKGHAYLGTILISDKHHAYGGEFGLVYEKNNFNLNSSLKHETFFDYSGNLSDDDKKKDKAPKSNPTEKLLHKEEFLFNLGYKGRILELKSLNKVKGKVFTNKNQVDTDKYKVTGENDLTVLSAYTENEIKAKSRNFEFRLESKYRYNMNLDNSKEIFHGHVGLAGLGITYENNTDKLNSKHSIDARYVMGYVDIRPLAVVNAWFDNKSEYRVNDKLKLIGELNLTSSNRLGMIFQVNEIEILGFGDTKVGIEYKVNERIETKNEIGAKAIGLFKYIDNQGSSGNDDSLSRHLVDLFLHGQYNYKVYNNNSLSYKVKEGIKVTSKLGLSYSNMFDSDRLYTALRDIKRKQIDENGIAKISKKDIEKIREEKTKFGLNIDQKILLNPGVEVEFKFLDDKLSIKPKGEVIVEISSNNTQGNGLDYRNAEAKVGLYLDYKW
ncbi:hypothetical protein [Streptobacillus ratti]|uniref:hypothetical protein n=1 Tax=Streptobacillus ratti TaxID=1720557 RepID=UPI000B144F5E|nr:hypothetical protein [Streptobacillus ratti]